MSTYKVQSLGVFQQEEIYILYLTVLSLSVSLPLFVSPCHNTGINAASNHTLQKTRNTNFHSDKNVNSKNINN